MAALPPLSLSLPPRVIDNGEYLASAFETIYKEFPQHTCLKTSGDKATSYRYYLSSQDIYIAGKKLIQVQKDIYEDAGKDLTCEWIYIFENSEEKFITANFSHLELHTFLGGNELERVTHKDCACINKWDNWEKNDPYATERYDNFIHPAIANTVYKISQLMHRPLIIADLGGGTGKLAQLIESKNCTLHIDVADSCKSLLKKFPGKPISSTYLDLENRLPYKNKSFDVVILCGVVAKQVLTRVSSQKLIQEAKRILKPQGFLLCGQHSFSQLDSSDYHTAGFKVLNRSLRCDADLSDYYILTI